MKGQSTKEAVPRPENDLITVKDLSLDYVIGRRRIPALHEVSLSISAGESVSIVGESGSGKTTTANALLGLLPSSVQQCSGHIQVGGHSVIPGKPHTYKSVRGRVASLVPQDPTASLNPTMRIGYQVGEAVKIARPGISTGDLYERVLELLEKVGLDSPGGRIKQYPHELSGGMRQRVLIAIALASRPQVIIADEPTSALDVTVQKKILDHLGGLVEEENLALLMITHDLAVAAERTDRMVVMQGGRVVEEGPAEEVVVSSAQPYTRRLIEAAPAFRTAAPSARRDPPGEAKAAIRWENVAKTFPLPGQNEKFYAVNSVTLEAAVGRTLAVVGESGSGKTTLIRTALALEKPDAGRIWVSEREIGQKTPKSELRELRRTVQLVQQNPFSSLNPKWTIARSIAEPLRGFGILRKRETVRRVREVLDEVQLPSSFLDRYPRELSGGQRQRVAIARALALRPESVLLDEPVSALDVSVQAQILDLLTTLQENGDVTFVLVTHDLSVVKEVAHDVAVLRKGRLVETGPVKQVFSDPQSEFTEELLRATAGRELASRLSRKNDTPKKGKGAS